MYRKFQQDLEADLQHIGADYRIEQQRKHACIILRANGRTRKVFASNTPSDRRRYPGEPLRCPYMIELDEAMRELAAECLREELAADHGG